MPFQRRFCSIHPDTQIVFFADRNLRGAQYTLCSAFVANEQISIIFELSSFDKRRELGAKLVDLQTSDVSAKIFRVSSDIADTPRGAGLLRVCPPGRLFLSLFVNWLDEPALRIFGNNLQNFPKFATANKLARLLDHRVTRV